MPHNIGLMVVLVLLAGAWFVLQLGSGIFGPIEKFGTRLARRKSLAIFAIAAAAALLRISLLGVLPIPVPVVHDEFSNLLAANHY